ncbi:MAG: hypothetical protein ACXACI_03285 [Candidatus Hodarchaeales archaeon]|jgi:hypothetical protein
MIPTEVRKRIKEIKAKTADLDSSENRIEAGDIFFDFAKELIIAKPDSSRSVQRSAAKMSYQALIRYLMAGETRKISDVVRFAQDHQLIDLSYQLEEAISRAKGFLEERGWEDIELVEEGIKSDHMESIEKANVFLKTAKSEDSEGNYLSAAKNYMNASKILFSALEGKLLLEQTEEPVRNALLRLVMADEWELASEFVAEAQSHSIPIRKSLIRKIASRTKLIEEYMSGERQIQVMANVDLRGMDDPEKTVGRVMRDGFPFSFAENKEITVLSAWRLDYLRGVIPIELGDICPETTENIPITRLICSVHDNYGADTLMLDFKTPHFTGSMVFSTSEALDLEIIHLKSNPA